MPEFKPNFLVNLTPHDIFVHCCMSGDYRDDMSSMPKSFYFPATGVTVRLGEAPRNILGTVAGVPYHAPPTFTNPEFSDCESYTQAIDRYDRSGIIVSSIVGAELAKRGWQHVYSPDTGPDCVVRDNDGRIIGTNTLIKWC